MTEDPPPTHCVLRDRMFRSFGEPVFRRSDADGAPQMVVTLGERRAVMPLRAVQREFGIRDDSPDGRMLALIGQALDFVPVLRPGDKLPSEVLTGEASWTPEPRHVAAASARLRTQLADWLSAAGGFDRRLIDGEALLRVADDPRQRAHVQAALARAAAELDLPDADAVLPVLEALAQELGHIEALRDRLLLRMRRTTETVEWLSRRWRGDAHHSEALTQVRRLGAAALAETQARFDELDAKTGAVMTALRDAESQRGFIRAGRDWLYRSRLAWEPLLAEWEQAAGDFDQAMMNLIQRTYQFLAPRYMPVRDWRSAGPSPPLTLRRPGAGMVW